MNIDVVGKRGLWLGISAGVIGLGIIAMIYSALTIGSPLRLGIDFTGGTLWQLQFKDQAPSVAEVRAVLTEKDLGSSIIQTSGEKEMLIRSKPLTQEERLDVQKLMQTNLKTFTIEKIESVGPTLGQELLLNSVLALIVTLLGIYIYMTIRFQWDYAFFAILALIHDVLVTTGFFAILGLVFGTEIDSLFIVALLTIAGFSVNDTVIVFDRVRENVKFISRKKTFAEIVNQSVNQTFGRSINTSVTALLTLFALFFFGGPTLRDFSLALIVGFVSGAYSSIFNASILLVIWREYQQNQRLKEKEA